MPRLQALLHSTRGSGPRLPGRLPAWGRRAYTTRPSSAAAASTATPARPRPHPLLRLAALPLPLPLAALQIPPRTQPPTNPSLNAHLHQVPHLLVLLGGVPRHAVAGDQVVQHVVAARAESGGRRGWVGGVETEMGGGAAPPSSQAAWQAAQPSPLGHGVHRLERLLKGRVSRQQRWAAVCAVSRCARLRQAVAAPQRRRPVPGPQAGQPSLQAVLMHPATPPKHRPERASAGVRAPHLLPQVDGVVDAPAGGRRMQGRYPPSMPRPRLHRGGAGPGAAGDSADTELHGWNAKLRQRGCTGVVPGMRGLGRAQAVEWPG